MSKEVEVIETLVSYLDKGAWKISGVEQKVLLIETTMRIHERILTDGNGAKALVVQVSDNTYRIQDLENEIKDLKDELASMRKAAVEAKTQTRNAIMGLIGTVIVAMAAIIAAWVKGGD